jgi:GR25 family glycosyltransferase involved in LPS biosynthesis
MIDWSSTYVINLDRSSERLATFKRHNPHLDDIRRFSAIDGSLINKQQLLTDGTIRDDLSYLSGTLGCALSHVSLWKKAIEEDRVVTVFEDDAICSVHFAEESERILSVIPEDWDMIKWGAIFRPSYVWANFGFSKAKLQFYDRRYMDDQITFQRTKYSWLPIRMAHSFGMQAYSLTPNGARKLVDHCLPLRKRLIQFPEAGVVIDDVCIDCAINVAYPFMQTFICLPPLVVHDETQPSERIAKDRET